MARRKRIYWDSDAFLGYFNNEPDKQSKCEGVLQAADEGAVVIVTSALTLTEVLYVKGKSKMDVSKRDLVDQFFKSDYISVHNVTRPIANMARDLVWDHNVRPKDAIHVATATINKVEELNTFDEKLLGLDGKTGKPILRICKPHHMQQLKIEMPEDE